MIRRSIAYSTAETYLGLLIQLASTIALARLLTPAEIGVYATAAVFTALASKFRDFGLSEYLIQLNGPTAPRIDAAFTVNVIASAGATLLLLAASWPVGWFFASQAVSEVMRLQGIAFLIVPFGAIHLAWHHRSLNFRPIFFSGLASNLASALTSVSCAYAGVGTMSLAWGALAGIGTSVAVSLLLRAPGLRPRLTTAGLREAAAFGGHMSKIMVYGQLGKSAPDVAIAKVVDFAAVAFFSRASGLVDLFNQSVMRIVSLISLPYLAESHRGGTGRAAAFVRVQTYVTAIGWPFFATLMLLAEPAVRILYGDQWSAAVPLVRIMCGVAAVELSHALARDLLLSAGLPGAASRLEGLTQVVRLLALALVFPFGAIGACVGLLLASVVNLVYVYRVLALSVLLDLGDVWRSLRPSLILAMAGALPSVAWIGFSASWSDWFIESSLVAGALSVLVWGVTLWILDHPLKGEVVLLADRLRARQ